MAGLEEMINSVLSDPEQMNMISSLAQSLMGGESAPEPKQDMGIDPKLFSRVQQLMGGADKGGAKSEALLRAMQPYLSEKRRVKMDKALKLARLAKLAGFAMDELGGEER